MALEACVAEESALRPEGLGAVWRWENSSLWISCPGARCICGLTFLWRFHEIKPMADFFCYMNIQE